MRKIAILTFHKSINYGSVLQTWALCNILKKYEVEVIDYEPEKYKYLYSLFRPVHLSRPYNIRYNMYRLIDCVSLWNQINKFKVFRNEKLNLVHPCTYNNCDYNKIFSDYDAIITGSDQIWNVRAIDCDPIFFLPFKFDGIKIAYACSINDMDFTENKVDDELRANILDYNFISLRELSGVKKLSEFINHKKIVYNTLDPTLFNTKEDFMTITSPRIIECPYIFLYNVWSNTAGVEAAKKISKIFNLPVYTAVTRLGSMSIRKIESNGIHVAKKDTSPEDFLSLICYSDFVITESFHGTAFSLIFEKQFISINDTDNAGNRKNDERLESILEIMGLSNRYITVEEIDEFDFFSKINFCTVTKIRMKEAENSLKLLYGAIEGEINS